MERLVGAARGVPDAARHQQAGAAAVVDRVRRAEILGAGRPAGPARRRRAVRPDHAASGLQGAVEVEQRAADGAGPRDAVERRHERRQPARLDLGVVVEQVQQAPARVRRTAQVRAAGEAERHVAGHDDGALQRSVQPLRVPGLGGVEHYNHLVGEPRRRLPRHGGETAEEPVGTARRDDDDRDLRRGRRRQRQHGRAGLRRSAGARPAPWRRARSGRPRRCRRRRPAQGRRPKAG